MNRPWREVDSALCEALLAVSDADSALDVVETMAADIELDGVGAARDALHRQIGGRCGGRVYADGDEVIVVDPDTQVEEVVYYRADALHPELQLDGPFDWWTEVETAVQELMETRSRLECLEARMKGARRRESESAVLMDRVIADLAQARLSARRVRPLMQDGDES